MLNRGLKLVWEVWTGVPSADVSMWFIHFFLQLLLMVGTQQQNLKWTSTEEGSSAELWLSWSKTEPSESGCFSQELLTDTLRNSAGKHFTTGTGIIKSTFLWVSFLFFCHFCHIAVLVAQEYSRRSADRVTGGCSDHVYDERDSWGQWGLFLRLLL